MKRALLVIAGVVILGLTAAVGTLYVTQDRTEPEITVSDTASKVYSEGQSNKELLNGVKAVDNKDGDVSDSLIIERVVLNSSGTEAAVTYAAVDQSGNVSKLTQTYPCKAAQDAPLDTETGVEVMPADESAENTDIPAENPESTAETAVQDQEAAEAANTEAAIAALPEGSPQLRLSQHYLTLQVGDEFSQLSYISDITDTKDSRERLYRMIQIEGTVDTAVPGTYDLSYYVTDSDGHQSNVEVLHVTVA